MTPTNRKVLDFVLASPVGKAMSDADRDALTAALERTDARDLQGWLGEQVRKAARVVVEKGDYDGHPFRGNQWTDASGAGRGGAGASPRGRNIGQRAETPAEERARSKREFREFQEERARTAKPSTPPSGDPKSMSTADLKAAADELAASIEESIAFAEVENDLGRSDSAKVTLREVKARQAELKEIRREIESRAKQTEAETQRRAAKTPITAENLDDDLKGSESKKFKADHSAAVKAAKDFREFVGEVADRARAAGVKGASKLLKEALQEVKRFEETLNRANRPTIRNALVNFSELNNAGENAKGAIREVLDMIDQADAKRQGPSGTRTTARQARGAAGAKQEARDTDRSAALQDASDKDFGMSSDKYNMLDAWGVLENN